MPLMIQCKEYTLEATCQAYHTVGSSSSNRSGSINSARARAIRIRHPPEKVFVAFRCISEVKLRP